MHMNDENHTVLVKRSAEAIDWVFFRWCVENNCIWEVIEKIQYFSNNYMQALNNQYRHSNIWCRLIKPYNKPTHSIYNLSMTSFDLKWIICSHYFIHLIKGFYIIDEIN